MKHPHGETGRCCQARRVAKALQAFAKLARAVELAANVAVLRASGPTPIRQAHSGTPGGRNQLRFPLSEPHTVHPTSGQPRARDLLPCLPFGGKVLFSHEIIDNLDAQSRIIAREHRTSPPAVSTYSSECSAGPHLRSSVRILT